jgi:hypothetical protein
MSPDIKKNCSYIFVKKCQDKLIFDAFIKKERERERERERENTHYLSYIQSQLDQTLVLHEICSKSLNHLALAHLSVFILSV